MAKGAVSPSSGGVRPNMHKMYDGRNTATRPIPIIVDSSDARAIAAAAADQKPKLNVTNLPSGPRPQGADAIFGTKVAAPGNVINTGLFDPSTGVEHME